MAAADGIFSELQREIDDCMATHGLVIAEAMSISNVADPWRLRLPIVDSTHRRLSWMATTISHSRLCETIQFLLGWLSALEGGRIQAGSSIKSASWLVAQLITTILQELLTRTAQPETVTKDAAEKMVEQVLDRCVVVFQETFQSDAARAVESSGGFFMFKPAVLSQLRAPTPEHTLQEHVVDAWRHVLAISSLQSLNPVRLRLQRQLLRDLLEPKNATTSAKDYLYLKNLTTLRLGLNITTFLSPSNFSHKVKEAAIFLRILQPLTLKPYKPVTRLTAISTIASMLNNELEAVDLHVLNQVHSAVHAVSEWNSCISELHSVALKLCGRREFAIAAWELRVALLCLSPNEIFGRYWKEDVHALLRMQYQYNKDGGSQALAILQCVELCFLHMLKRHALTARRLPSELDCMEVINTTQAWCFFAYPKFRSLSKLQHHVLPSLVRISIGIASYNMMYAIQSHLRRLLLEADHIFDEKKLVGLEALLALLKLAYGHDRQDAAVPLDRRALQSNRSTLGELVGQALIEANTHFGADLLIENSSSFVSPAVGASTSAIARLLKDDYRRSLAIQSCATALTALRYLYRALELSDDQKMLILARSCIHREPSIRSSAAATLHHLIVHEEHQAGAVFRCLTDYLFRLSNHLTQPRDFEAFLVLIQLIASLLRAASVDENIDDRVCAWESRKVWQESLLQIEAIAVYLLVFEDSRLLLAAVETLELVALARPMAVAIDEDSVAATVERPRVIQVLKEAEWELHELLFSFDGEKHDANSTGLHCFRRLVNELATTQPRASFRWSSALAALFARLALWNPEVAAFMWNDVADKVAKLEPVMPSPSALFEPDSLSGGGFDLARWRNLAVLATATSCPNLLYQSTDGGDDDEASKGASVQSVISSSAVQALFKRLARYMKSPSMDQKKAVVLALGSTHVSALPILLEVLQKYESEAFTIAAEQPSSRHASLGEITPPVIHRGVPGYSAVNSPVVGVRKLTKEQRVKHQKALTLLSLQWAVGRCYRLLLQATTQRPLFSDDTTREAVNRLQVVAIGVLEKIAGSLSSLQQHHGRGGGPSIAAPALTVRDVPHYLLFMLQQDFCSSLRSLATLLVENRALYSSYGSMRRRAKQHHSVGYSTVSSLSDSYRSDDSSPLLHAKLREAWYHLLLSWCHSFSSLANARLSANLSGEFFSLDSPARDHWIQRCDVLGDRVDDSLVIPWHWMDEGDSTRALGIEEAAMASFERYFLCQTAFASLPIVVHGPLFLPTPITQDSAILRWIDECFAVSVGENDSNAAPHFATLQRCCHRVLDAFLASSFRVFIEVCVDKSFFSVASGDKHNVAKHYFRAVARAAEELKLELTRPPISQSPVSPPVSTVMANGKPFRPSFATVTNLQVRLCHSILLHLGIDSDADQRQHAVDLINQLYANREDSGGESHDLLRLNVAASSAKRSSTVFLTQVTNRMQVAGSAYLVSKLSPCAFSMSLSILRFLSCCEPTQQRKMLAVVLPWLAEIPLAATGHDMEQLLSLLFRITTNLSTTCSDQLEQAWLTLAFTAATDVPSSTPSNLTTVLQFLFLQRATPVRLSTAKAVVWWLCRWQSAAHEVLRELLLLVETRRIQSAEATTTAQPTIQPVDDVFVFVILLSDSCCHLAAIPTYLYQLPAMREAMVVQAVHYAFLTLFALALDPKAFAVHRAIASPSGGAVGEDQQHSMYMDANSDCIVFLRNVLTQLSAPTELLEAIVDDLAQWSAAWTSTSSGVAAHGKDGGSPYKSRRQFEHAMASFAACLPLSIRNAWALECMKEITLALVPGSTLLSPTSSRCNNVQVLYCVRFGLLGYRVLEPEFHGDVFLSLLDLLHHALEEHPRDPSNANAVIRDTLTALKSMVAGMPPQRLALYPQVLWVCVALLGQHTSDYLPFHAQIVELLVEVLRVPHFATNTLLHDVLLSKKPPRWTDEQASVLRTLVWSLDRGKSNSHRLILHVVTRLLVLPSPVFHANATEHLLLSTMTLVPFLVATKIDGDSGASSAQADQHEHSEATGEDGDEGDDDEELEDIQWGADAMCIATDLQYAWLAAGSSLLGHVFATLTDDQESAGPEEDGSQQGRSFAQQFASAFVAQVLAVISADQVATCITMCFEILVKILSSEDIRKQEQLHLNKGLVINRPASTRDSGVVTATLWLVEGFMSELSQRKVSWRPTSTLLGSLARIVREPDQTVTWEAAVRIMNCLGPSGRSLSSSSQLMTPVVKVKKPQLTVATSVPVANESPPHSSGRNPSGAGTPSKKERTSSGARMFMGLLGHRSSPSASPSHNQPHHYGSATETVDAKLKGPSALHDPAEERSPSPISRRQDL